MKNDLLIPREYGGLLPWNVWLFVRVAAELDERLALGDLYNVLCTSRLLRVLFLDSHPLLNVVQRELDLRARFALADGKVGDSTALLEESRFAVGEQNVTNADVI